MLNWKILTITGIAVLGFLVIFITGCNKVDRHKILSFFFDGVPPLEAKTEVREDVAAVDVNEQAVPIKAQGGAKQRRTVHGPNRECTQCHKKQEKAGRWGMTKLEKDVPEMCYDCHKNYMVSELEGQYVHGPVAIGECSFCHDPHDSRFDFLLNESIPQLCYRCHEQRRIELISAHDEDTISRCNLCHEAHSSSKKKLLK